MYNISHQVQKKILQHVCIFNNFDKTASFILHSTISSKHYQWIPVPLHSKLMHVASFKEITISLWMWQKSLGFMVQTTICICQSRIQNRQMKLYWMHVNFSWDFLVSNDISKSLVKFPGHMQSLSNLFLVSSISWNVTTTKIRKALNFQIYLISGLSS